MVTVSVCVSPVVCVCVGGGSVNVLRDTLEP